MLGGHSNGTSIGCGYSIPPLRCPADSWALTKGRPPFTLEEQKAQGIAGWTNVNECKLRCPNTIGADHTRCYHGSKRGQAVTIERLSLGIPSHTGREVSQMARQGHTPVWLLAEYSSHPNIWLGNGATPMKLRRKGKARRAVCPWVQDSSKRRGLTRRPGTLA